MTGAGVPPQVQVTVLDACASTQDEVLARLGDASPGGIVAVRTRSQLAGRGREGRAWQDPPGDALLLSVGVRGPVDTAVLDELPRRVARAVVAAITQLAGEPGAAGIAWKAPNDLVDAGGAKLAGLLVDARTTGGSVDHVVVGIGCNVAGAAFTTADGRRATSLAALGVEVEVDALARAVTAQVARLLSRRCA